MPSEKTNGLSTKAYGVLAGIMASLMTVGSVIHAQFVIPAIENGTRKIVGEAIQAHVDNPPHVSVREFDLIRQQLDRIEQRIEK